MAASSRLRKADEIELLREALALARAEVEATRLRAAAAEERLQGLWRHLLDAIPEMLWTLHSNGEVYYNALWLEFTGVDLEEGRVRRIDLVHPEDREFARRRWQYCLRSGAEYVAEYRLRHHSGDYRWVRSRGSPKRNRRGEIVCWYGVCSDIHDRVLVQQELSRSERLNRGIISATPDCISILDQDGTVVFVNEATIACYDVTDAKALIGSPWGSLLPPGARDKANAALAAARQGGIGRVTLSAADGTAPNGWWDVVIVPVDARSDDRCREPGNIVVISRDISHQRAAEDRISWNANHDGLTQLPNRTLFQQRLDDGIEAAQQCGGRFVVLLLDVDDFKRINDTLGHDAGDALLKDFAERLRTAARADDTVARLGGDEFAVILPGVEDEASLGEAVGGLLAQLRRPLVHEGKMLDCHASIGASFYPDHGKSRSELMKHADLALYSAKAEGGCKCKLFEPAMRQEMQNRISMLHLARDALNRDLISPFYQPKIGLESGRLAGFEALLRWRHPRRGLQMPDSIAAAFDDINLAAEISDRMIERAIADIRGWLDRGVHFGHVAINAAAAEFRRGDFAERLLERMDKAAVPPECIQLEVTETVFLGRGAECVEQALRTLSDAGVQIALDDFGTGYASLSHLKQFPVDVIKIDRSFVRDIHIDPDDAAIVRAVINLGKSLGIKIIAEGVETDEQHEFLLSSGCEQGQGFLYGKALPAAEVPKLESLRFGPGTRVPFLDAQPRRASR